MSPDPGGELGDMQMIERGKRLASYDSADTFRRLRVAALTRRGAFRPPVPEQPEEAEMGLIPPSSPLAACEDDVEAQRAVAACPPSPPRPPSPPVAKRTWTAPISACLQHPSLRLAPVYAACVTTVAAYFGMRNYFFLDAQRTINLLHIIVPELQAAHGNISCALASIQIGLNLSDVIACNHSRPD